MIELLLKAYAAVNEAKAGGSQGLKRRQVKEFERSYDRILSKGFRVNPLSEARGQPARRGRKKKTKARNLLERLRDHRAEVLAFMRDFSVPFDNNLAERPANGEGQAENLRDVSKLGWGTWLLPDQGLHLHRQEELHSGHRCPPGRL